VNEPRVYFTQTVENETIEAVEKVLATMRQKLGREPTTVELKRWAKVYRGVAERLEVLVILQERTASTSSGAPRPTRRRAEAKRGVFREEA
jgi:hypothetical protein